MLLESNLLSFKKKFQLSPRLVLFCSNSLDLYLFLDLFIFTTGYIARLSLICNSGVHYDKIILRNLKK